MHYMKIPMETVMKMPVQDRRYFIQKHNAEQEQYRAEREKKTGLNFYDGESINKAAKTEQLMNKKIRGGG